MGNITYSSSSSVHRRDSETIVNSVATIIIRDQIMASKCYFLVKKKKARAS